MKTFVLNLLAYVCAFSAYAQDIKVKKGQIMIDNNVVASIKEEKNGYLFSGDLRRSGPLYSKSDLIPLSNLLLLEKLEN